MKALILALMVAAIGACQPSGPLFRATVLQPDGTYPIPVVLGDQTGLVAAIEPAANLDPAPDLPAIRPDPEDPTAVIVSWGTGACDDDVAIALLESERGYRFDIAVNDGFSLGGCSAQLLIRQLRVRFSEAIPLDAIEVVERR